jgi:hypothetical protein
LAGATTAPLLLLPTPVLEPEPEPEPTLPADLREPAEPRDEKGATEAAERRETAPLLPAPAPAPAREVEAVAEAEAEVVDLLTWEGRGETAPLLPLRPRLPPLAVRGSPLCP